MEREAQGDDLNGSLETEYSNKVGLCVVLQKDRENQRGDESDSGVFFVEGKSVVNEALRERGGGKQERERQMASFTSYSSTQRAEPSNLNESESKYWKN